MLLESLSLPLEEELPDRLDLTSQCLVLFHSSELLRSYEMIRSVAPIFSILKEIKRER